MKKIFDMIHAVLIVFIIGSIPGIPAGLLNFYVHYSDTASRSLNIASEVFMVLGNFCSLVNSTLNFFIYILRIKRYQRTLRDMFDSIKKRGIPKVFSKGWLLWINCFIA